MTPTTPRSPRTPTTPGRAVQVDPMKPVLKGPKDKRLKSNVLDSFQVLLSNSTCAATTGSSEADAMETFGDARRFSGHFESAMLCYAESARLGSPSGMFKLGRSLESGEGDLALDAPVAAELYRKAAGSGHAEAAWNLRFMREVGRGVVRSKQCAMQALRKAAENGKASACATLARAMIDNHPYARKVGQIDDLPNMPIDLDEDEAGFRVLLASALEWLKRSAHYGGADSSVAFLAMSDTALTGDKFCCNTGCEFVAHRNNFKVCPGCKFYRYCGPACQKADWHAGGHKRTCCTYQANFDQR